MRNLPIATGNNDNQLQVNIDGRQYHLEFKNGEIDSIISQYNNLKLTISKINLQKLEHLKNEYFIPQLHKIELQSQACGQPKDHINHDKNIPKS